MNVAKRLPNPKVSPASESKAVMLQSVLGSGGLGRWLRQALLFVAAACGPAQRRAPAMQSQPQHTSMGKAGAVEPKPAKPYCTPQGLAHDLMVDSADEIDLMVTRCDAADRCELACLRDDCGAIWRCRRECKRAAARASEAGSDGDLGFASATVEFERRDPAVLAHCSTPRDWYGPGLPSGVVEDYREQEQHKPPSTPAPPKTQGCTAGQGQTDVTEIALQRTACFGACPSYWARLHADGSVEMFGGALVPHLGLHHGALPSGLFQRLAGLALELGFFGLDDSYSCPVTDNPTAYISVARGSSKRVIRHYAPAMTGPHRLRLLEETVDQYLEYVEWTD